MRVLKRGRPTELTEEVLLGICEALRGGNYRSTACAAVGIHRHTLTNWEKWGNEGKEPYASFLIEMEKAEAEGEVELLRRVREGDDAWQSKSWVLERRWPARWSGRVRVTVTEHVNELTARLKADPELHRKVADVLADQEPAADGAGTAH